MWKLPRSNIGGLLGAYYVTSIYGCLRKYLSCLIFVQLPNDDVRYRTPSIFMVQFVSPISFNTRQNYLKTKLMLSRNAAGHTKKVTTTAVLFVAQCVGNVRFIYVDFNVTCTEMV